MDLHRTFAITLRQFYLMRGSIARVVPLFAWVGVDMVLWGFMSRYLSALTSTGLNFVATLLGAVLLWDFFTRVMQGVHDNVLRRRLVEKFSECFRLTTAHL